MATIALEAALVARKRRRVSVVLRIMFLPSRRELECAAGIVLVVDGHGLIRVRTRHPSRQL
jgi:hypothetical protein